MLRFSPVIFAALVVSTTACFAQNIPAATFLPSTQDNLLFNPKWWPSQQKVMPSDGEFRDLFGRAVALSADGRIALVGAPGKAVGSIPRHGAAYVFAINNDTWRETAELPISGSVAGRLCGTSVALSSDGHTALVGCQGDVYVYKHMNGSWNQTTEFTVSGLRLMAGFGLSVALSADGQIALIGAPDKTVGGNNQQGAAYVFTFQNGAWSRPEQLIATNGVALSRFGWSVALSSDGHTALVGVPFNPRGHESTPGSAYVYQLSDVSWRQTARMTVPNDVTYDGFGIAVALSADGHTALVGAPAKKTLNTLSGRYLDGAVYLYTLSGGRWG
ncbi:MAG: FG-GAP repeat protein [Gammaproteobacteria bacterium]